MSRQPQRVSTRATDGALALLLFLFAFEALVIAGALWKALTL